MLNLPRHWGDGMSDYLFSPGSLVSARGREWVVLTGSTTESIRVRPVTGSEDDQTVISLPLEPEPVREARFPAPDGIGVFLRVC